MVGLIIAGFVSILTVIVILQKVCRRKTIDLKGRHVVVVGGSSGIGLSVADYVLSLGANVTIAARDAVKLERSAAVISSKHPASQQRVFTSSLDVTAGLEPIKQAFSDAEAKAGPIHMLVICAGTAICGRLEDISEKDVRWLTDLNFLGTLWSMKTVLPSMKERGEGSIVLVSTQAALLGIYGYSVYGATKWAVRGLGEAAMMEVIGTGVSVTISFPPDTDTPGFEAEEASKPPETKIISGSGGLYSPDAVAKQLVHDALNGKPYSVIGMEGWMLSTMCGMTSSGFVNTLVQSVLMGPLRIVLLCYQYYFQHIICKFKNEKNTNKKVK